MPRNRIGLICMMGLLLSTFADAELMDPTRPPDFTPKGSLPVEHIAVDAIIYSLDRKIAVINGKPLMEGQELSGNRVVQIRENAVQLDSPSGRITLNLVREPVKNKE